MVTASTTSRSRRPRAAWCRARRAGTTRSANPASCISWRAPKLGSWSPSTSSRGTAPGAPSGQRRPGRRRPQGPGGGWRRVGLRAVRRLSYRAGWRRHADRAVEGALRPEQNPCTSGYCRCAQPTGSTNHRGTGLTEAETHRGQNGYTTCHMLLQPLSSPVTSVPLWFVLSQPAVPITKAHASPEADQRIDGAQPTGSTNHRDTGLTEAEKHRG